MAPIKKPPTTSDSRTEASREAHRIVNELIEQDPPLKAARERMGARGLGVESIAQRLLRSFRQGFKEK